MSPTPLRRSTRGWSVLVTLLLAAALLLLGSLALTLSGLTQLGPLPFSLVIDGDTVINGMSLTSLQPAEQAALIGALTLAALLVVVVVPLTLLAVAALVFTVVMLSLGLPLLLMGALFVLLLSPLWLLLLGAWWLVRRSGRTPRSATMAA